MDVGQTVNREYTAGAELLNAGSHVLLDCLLNIFHCRDHKKSALIRDYNKHPGYWIAATKLVLVGKWFAVRTLWQM